MANRKSALRSVLLICEVFSFLIFFAHTATGAVQKPSTFFRTENGVKYKVLHYPKGTHIISKPLLISSNTILEGEGYSTKLVPVPKYAPISRFIANEDFKNGNENIIIRNLRIDFFQNTLKGADPGILRFQFVKNLTLENITMNINSQFYGIDIAASCQNVLISSCNVTNKGRGGCLMVRNQDARDTRASRFIKIRNNVFTSSAADEPVGIFGWLGLLRDIEVTDNVINAKGASFGLSIDGVVDPRHTGKTLEVVISGNNISGSRTGAISVKGGATGVLITKNTITSTAKDGIFLHAGSDHLPSVGVVRVTENQINGIGRHGIFSTGTDIDIENNTIVDCAASGIYVGDNVTAVRNFISNSHPGIFVDGHSNRFVSFNTLINSTIQVGDNNWNGISDNIFRSAP